MLRKVIGSVRSAFNCLTTLCDKWRNDQESYKSPKVDYCIYNRLFYGLPFGARVFNVKSTSDIMFADEGNCQTKTRFQI